MSSDVGVFSLRLSWPAVASSTSKGTMPQSVDQSVLLTVMMFAANRLKLCTCPNICLPWCSLRCCGEANTTTVSRMMEPPRRVRLANKPMPSACPPEWSLVVSGGFAFSFCSCLRSNSDFRFPTTTTHYPPPTQIQLSKLIKTSYCSQSFHPKVLPFFILFSIDSERR